MPETKTRRNIKAYKAQVSRLQKQIRAEEKLVALKAQVSYMQDKLASLRDPQSASYSPRGWDYVSVRSEDA